MTIPIYLPGVGGRMGRALAHCAIEAKDIRLAAVFEAPRHPWIGQNLNQVLAAQFPALQVRETLEGAPEEGRVIGIHFTWPEPTMAWVDWSRTHDCPMVIGTTGFSSEDQERLLEASKSIPIVMAPNMSIGVNLLYSICRRVAHTVGDTFDIEISDFHHKFKKDAPSGTALHLGRVIAEEMGVDLEQASAHGRQGDVGARPKGQIGFHAMRGGDLVSEHTVTFSGRGERLALNHLGYSRECFAEGAMAAARFVIDKKSGMFDMQDVLDLR